MNTNVSPPPSAPAVELSGWGLYPVVRGHQVCGEDLELITREARLSRGLGRSYGDSSLPAAEADLVAGSPLADRLVAFDPATGIVRAEAGFPLFKLNRLFLPRGWFTSVTPGTHYVTLGGMVAADVHGKNHHVDGCFGEHVTALKMRVADGRVLECSDDNEPELLRATLGGMGLTGHILEVEFRMRRIASPWIWQESEQTPDFDAAEAPGALPRFRSAPALPFLLPSWLLQPWMVRIGNELNYRKHGARIRTGIVHPETYFYPLDVVRQWNRLYGKRGFTQYQCVLPEPQQRARHRGFLDLLQARGAEVFLCVIKDCGPEGKGMLSFPRPGVSYALDIPIGARTQSLVDALNEYVIAEGGRIYLAKDAFTRAEHFRAMEPRLEAWNEVRRRWDPQGRLRSAQSVRLLGDQA